MTLLNTVYFCTITHAHTFAHLQVSRGVQSKIDENTHTTHTHAAICRHNGNTSGASTLKCGI